MTVPERLGTLHRRPTMVLLLRLLVVIILVGTANGHWLDEAPSVLSAWNHYDIANVFGLTFVGHRVTVIFKNKYIIKVIIVTFYI